MPTIKNTHPFSRFKSIFKIALQTKLGFKEEHLLLQYDLGNCDSACHSFNNWLGSIWYPRDFIQYFSHKGLYLVNTISMKPICLWLIHNVTI